MSHPTRLAELVSPQVAASEPRLLLVPLGSFEQHGGHLPFDTDTRVAVAVAEKLAAGRADTVVAPALPYGASGEHQGFGGTLSLGTQALHTVIVELARSLGPEFKGLVLLSFHGGNADAVRSAVTQLRAEGHHVTAVIPTVAAGDAHAGRTETSIMLALDPGAVRGEAARPGDTRPLDELMPELRRGGLKAVTESGVLGDPAGASAEQGRVLLDELVATATAQLEHWLEEETP